MRAKIISVILVFLLSISITACSSNKSSSNLNSSSSQNGNEISTNSLPISPSNPTNTPPDSKTENINTQVPAESKIRTVLKVPPTEDEKKIVDLPALPVKTKNNDEIIPNGWSMLDILQNDFNGDGLYDIVGVLEPPLVDNEMNPRILFVYMNNGNGYSRNLINQYLIRNRDEGGSFGDPYQQLTTDKNTFTTHTFGGSAWKWSENFTFTYRNGEWFLLYAEDTYGYGPFETSYDYNDYNTGVGKRRYTEESPGKENPKKLEFRVKLDDQPTLAEFAFGLNGSQNRIKAPIIKSIGYNSDVTQFEGDIRTLSTGNILYQNKEYIIYRFNQSKNIAFIAIYNYAQEHLQVITRYDYGDHDAINQSDYNCKIYKNRLYISEDITKMVDVRKDGEIKKQSEIVAVQLVSMNVYGSDKKVLFKADQSKYKEGEIIDSSLDYISLNYEITGNEIIVKVYDGNISPYYRMNLDGGDRKLIGNVPRGAW